MCNVKGIDIKGKIEKERMREGETVRETKRDGFEKDVALIEKITQKQAICHIIIMTTR